MTCQIVLQHAVLGITLTVNAWIGNLQPELTTRMIIDDMPEFIAVSRSCEEVVI